MKLTSILALFALASVSAQVPGGTSDLTPIKGETDLEDGLYQQFMDFKTII